jgi:hypothetical protein
LQLSFLNGPAYSFASRFGQDFSPLPVFPARLISGKIRIESLHFLASFFFYGHTKPTSGDVFQPPLLIFSATYTQKDNILQLFSVFPRSFHQGRNSGPGSDSTRGSGQE